MGQSKPSLFNNTPKSEKEHTCRECAVFHLWALIQLQGNQQTGNMMEQARANAGRFIDVTLIGSNFSLLATLLKTQGEFSQSQVRVHVLLSSTETWIFERERGTCLLTT